MLFGMLLSQAKDLPAWLSLRTTPLIILNFCFLISFFLSWVSPDLLSLTSLQNNFEILASPEGKVSGPDLLIALLAISALTESAGFAYLCLPSDRAEIRLASITKSILIAVLIEPQTYENWYHQLPEPEKTAQRKVLLGLMSPRDGLGGWFGIGPADFDAAMGKDMWDRLSRYFDNHQDDAWVRLCMLSLATGLVMGLACLFYRYFGANKFAFHPTEFGAIFLLLILNGTVAAILVSLALGYQRGEHIVFSRIKIAVNEVKPHIERWNKERLEQGLERLREELESPQNRPRGRRR
jgi:hypothetical protein